MKSINIKECLYHGINGYSVSKDIDNTSLYILEKILRSEKLLSLSEIDFEECKLEKSLICNIYSDLGFYPVIKRSLGFYPTDQEIFELSKKGYETCFDESIMKHITKENIIDGTIDDYLMKHGLKGDYAWMKYYSDIILLFDKKLLFELKTSWGSMIDEIAVDEPILLRKYLLAIGLKPECYSYQDGNRIYEYYDQNIEKIKNIYLLLKEYNYDIPIVDFPNGGNVLDKQYVKVKVIKC